MLIRFGKKKQNKWHNKPCEYKGIKFASHKERDRYIFLEGRQNAGEITDLRCQYDIEIIPHITETIDVQLKTKVKQKTVVVQKAIEYRADFVYTRDGNIVYEDVKGSKGDANGKGTLTKVYQLKKKLLRALKGIEVVEIYNPTEWTHVNYGKKPR